MKGLSHTWNNLCVMEPYDFTLQITCLRDDTVFNIRKPKLLCARTLPLSVSPVLKLNNYVSCEIFWHCIISEEATNILDISKESTAFVCMDV